MSISTDDEQIAKYVIENSLTFVPGNCGYGADGSTIRQGVTVFRNPGKWLGSIIIDPSNGSIEDTLPDGLIDPIKKRIIDNLKSTKDAYSKLYIFFTKLQDRQ